MDYSDRNEAVIQAYLSGQRYPELQKRFNLSNGQVAGIIFRYKNPAPTKKRLLTEQDIKIIRTMYKPRCRTYGFVAMARRLGVHPSVVKNAYYGITYRYYD